PTPVASSQFRMGMPDRPWHPMPPGFLVDGPGTAAQPREACSGVPRVRVLVSVRSNARFSAPNRRTLACGLLGLSVKSGRHAMARIARRQVLQLSSAGAVAAATGGLAGILASGRSPAFAQGTTLHWVRGSDYVPASDQMVRTRLNELAQKELGLKI